MERLKLSNHTLRRTLLGVVPLTSVFNALARTEVSVSMASLDHLCIPTPAPARKGTLARTVNWPTAATTSSRTKRRLRLQHVGRVVTMRWESHVVRRSRRVWNRPLINGMTRTLRIRCTTRTRFGWTDIAPVPLGSTRTTSNSITPTGGEITMVIIGADRSLSRGCVPTQTVIVHPAAGVVDMLVNGKMVKTLVNLNMFSVIECRQITVHPYLLNMAGKSPHAPRNFRLCVPSTSIQF